MAQFSKQIAAFSQKSQDKANRVLRQCALDVLRRVVIGSPVDTGRFRGNWQVSLGAPMAKSLDTVDKSGGSTISAGTNGIKNAIIGDSIFIVNNLPYAIPLENGHSRQAPNGIVGPTVKAFPEIFAQAVKAAKSE